MTRDLRRRKYLTMKDTYVIECEEIPRIIIKKIYTK